MPLLSRDRTRHWFVVALDAARRKYEFELWAYVIMPEHVHVLLRPRRTDYRVRLILQSIKQPVMRRAINYLRRVNPGWLKPLTNERTGKVHFWQPGGGYDRNVTSAETAWSMIEYIHMNPVRRRLADDPLNWPWSSARWYAGHDDVVLPVDGTPAGTGS